MLPTFPEELENVEGICAGVDEVGRGPGAGPVVAAYVVWNEEFMPKTDTEIILLDMIRDSKKLSEKQRNKLDVFIKENARDYNFGIASVEEIENLNIRQASMLAMHRALDKLKIPVDHILVDGNFFKSYKDIPYTCIIQGDSKILQIAAASIIAKCYRDNMMEELHNNNEIYKPYKWNKNKGYLTKEHIDAIRTYGITSYHRNSFIHL